MPRRIRKIIYHEDCVTFYNLFGWDMPEPEYMPYIGGKIANLIPDSAKITKGGHQKVDIPLFNESDATDIHLNLGIEGMYYLKQRFKYTLSEIIAEPEGIAIDVITSEGCLFWLFYNMTGSHQVLLTLRQSEDTENIARRIGKYCNDLKLRREVVSNALTTMNAVGVSTALMQPDYMTIEELGPYTIKELELLFGRSKRTVNSWFGSQITKAVRPYDKKANANLYDASDILNFADNKKLHLSISEVISYRFSKIKIVKSKPSRDNQTTNVVYEEDVEKRVKNYIRQIFYGNGIKTVSEDTLSTGLAKYLLVRVEILDKKESFYLISAYHAAIDFYRKYEKVQFIEYDDNIDYSKPQSIVRDADQD